MSEAPIAVTGLRKRFGPVLALDGMSFTVRAGQITGFVGPNGAGKSTTIRVICGLDAADQNAIPFSEVSPHRASLEEAYLELTRDAVEFRALGGIR